ncbi:asparagine synthase-domain-containing protein [Powellomyces hirtus]|nr:asparagine synthase-domain-containing protein [Powellomyces hirtus]
MIGDSGNILCFNGELFGGLDVPMQSNDTTVLSRALDAATSCNDSAANEIGFLKVVSSLQGPWAIVYYHTEAKRLFFGRDFLGRRSLLWRFPASPDEPFLIASVSPTEGSDAAQFATGWEEVPADGIYSFDFSSIDPNVALDLTQLRSILIHHPWGTGLDPTIDSILQAPFDRIDATVPESSLLMPLDQSDISAGSLPSLSLAPGRSSAVSELEQVLADAVRLRLESIPTPTAAGAPRLAILFSGGLDCICLAALADRFLPPGEPCDLLNVAFQNPRRQQALENQRKDKTKKGNSSLAEAGSGTSSRGDSNDTAGSASAQYDVPDRLTGRAGVVELTARYPDRSWQFVEIDVPYEEAIAARGHVMALMKPLNTEMDLSIAIAFWFASRGRGHITSQDGTLLPYESTPKVLLSGLGADEQLAGYSRHRGAFEQRGWEGLIQEVQLDIDRISSRNLGRDDRIVSDHGKEIRFPYLSERVISTLNAIPMHLKVDMRLPRGIGEKLLLRQLCRERFGLHRASCEPKRAVQFGARSAKMEMGTRSIRGGDTLKAG